MISIFDEIIQTLTIPIVPIIVISIIVIFSISRDKLGRVGPTLKQILIMVLCLILSLVPIIVIIILLLQPDLRNLIVPIAVYLPIVTALVLFFIAAIGFRKNEETALEE